MTAKLRDKSRPTLRPIAGFAIATGLVLLLSHSSAAAGGDQGPQLAATCASCHRLDGNDKGIPPIIGLSEKKLAQTMLDYRASRNPSHIMHVIALSLSDEEIASVARYLAAQGKQPP